MNVVPWFMLSPSPFSIAQYLILAVIVSRMLKAVKYKKPSQLFRFVDAVLVVGLFVLIGDLIWCAFCILKWGPLFPGDLLQISASFFRDLIGIFLLVLLVGDHFRSGGVLHFSSHVFAFIYLMVVFQGLWFLWAPSPAFTDYTFAWRNGSSLSVVIGSFLISHIFMRIPLWLSILSIRREKNAE